MYQLAPMSALFPTVSTLALRSQKLLLISTDWCHHALVGPRPALPTQGHTENSAAFDEFFRDTSYFNQINLALFNDSSLWVVSRRASLHAPYFCSGRLTFLPSRHIVSLRDSQADLCRLPLPAGAGLASALRFGGRDRSVPSPAGTDTRPQRADGQRA